MHFIQKNAEECVRTMLFEISKKNSLEEIDTVRETDYMDDGSPICLALTIDRRQRTAHFDFTGTGAEVLANINCPKAVVKSAIIYCLRCLVHADIPLNQGCLVPITV
jgi:5-oxoprolinase (ATP-hydrolysing)